MQYDEASGALHHRLGNDLYLAATAGGEPRKLASGLAPGFSPDGRKLACYGANDGVTQLWELDLASGASKPLRRLGRPVTLVRYPDQAHGFQGDALSDHWRRCLQFLKDHGV